MTLLPGRRPGDRRVRVGRVRPEIVEVAPRRRRRRPIPPPLAVVLGFAALIAVGTVLLALPPASADGSWTNPVTTLFTATSAVCVTGLVVVDTATHWSPFGQLVILALIELGGFGIATSSTLLLVLAIGRRTGLRDRLAVKESTGTRDLGAVMPALRRIAFFTIAVQAVGAAVLYVGRLAAGDDPLASAWWSIFHAGSAFNNAGFDIVGGFRSLVPYNEDPVVLTTIAVLIVLGGLGFAIAADVGERRGWRRLTLETKIVLVLTAILLVGGAVFVGAAEWDNPATLGSLSPAARAMNAAFLSVSARTAGFNSVDTGLLLPPTLFVVMALMFIGGASGSTAGGIKVNSLGVLVVAVLSVARGNPSAGAFGRRVPHTVVYRALAVATLGVIIVFAGTLAVEIATEDALVGVLFEAVSAFGTVGLSTGITPGLPEPALLVLVLVMFAGRLGPLTLVVALAARARPVASRPAVESLRIG
jgi:trk system potassium uptake protein TrkH